MPQVAPIINSHTPVQPPCSEIPLQIVSPQKPTLRDVPLSTGVCVPRGRLFDSGNWLLEGVGGVQSLVQTEVLHRWSDGSVRWMLTRFVARRLSPGRTSCTLINAVKQPTMQTTAADVQATGDQLRLLFGESDRANETGSNEQAATHLRPLLFDASGRPLQLRLSSLENTCSGPVYQQWCAQYECIEHPHVSARLQIGVWAATGSLQVDARLRNSRRAIHAGGTWDLGDAGSFRFRGFHLQVTAPPNEDESSTKSVSWKVAPHGKVRQQTDGGVLILQQGSGGPAFRNGNHRDESGRSTVRQRGFEARFETGTLRGHRCEPVVTLRGKYHCCTLAVPQFWQNFPSSIAATNDKVQAGLFPREDGQVFELQGGEQKTQSIWLNLKSATNQPASKTFDFHELDWVSQPPRCVQPLSWYRLADVFDWLPDDQSLSETSLPTVTQFDRWRRQATSGRHSIHQRRERFDEFGWRNFGDIPADHEQEHFTGHHTIASHYNNQFDLIYGGILNCVATGDTTWHGLFEPLARHVTDIDRYHTSDDRACFNGGLFWHTDHYVDAWTSTHRTYSRHNADGQAYGGGPSNEHNYTTGLLHHYFLTGDEDSRESVIGLADWVLAMDDGSQTIWGLLDNGPTGLASQTVKEDFHGPGRGAGNSINALVDAWLLTRHEHYLHYAERLIRRVVHPELDCDALHLSDAEGHWSYTVCLLAIGRYLSAKLEAEQLDEQYAYAQASLVHIGRWMADHEQPALDHPERLEYPTVAWAAQEFRKANVLRIAASCEDDIRIERHMRRQADRLSDAAWKYFDAFGEENLTARCLSIVLTEGLRDLFHRHCRPEYIPPANEVRQQWPAWQMFVPQKQRVKSMLRDPLTLLAASPQLLNPRRWYRTLKALRRQVGR